MTYDDLESTQPRSLHERGAKRPEGVIVGKGAEQFATLLVDEPYEEPMEPIVRNSICHGQVG